MTIVHADTEMKHDCRLNSVLDRYTKINLTLNKRKCVFKVKEVTYIGHKLTQEGIKPDAPTDKRAVERLLGTVNYLGKFILNLASVTEPIRVLLRKDIEFHWSHEQDKAFQEIKSVLTENGGPVLKFFGVQKPVTFSCDASPTGLGGVLLQDNCPVAYASRSLTEAESGYAQIEKELLLGSSVQPGANQPIRVWKDSARRIRSQTHRNHSEEALSDSTTQTTKILLRMQKYDYTLEYKPGRELVLPDMLSRAPLPDATDINNMEEEIALHVHLIQSSLTVSKLKLEEIREETAKDESLKDLIEIIKR